MERKRYTYWLEPKLYDKIDLYLEEANATSKSDFVRDAIKFYMGYLDMDRSVDILAPILSRAIKGEIEYFEMNMSEMLFKLAVESAKVNLVFTNFLKLDSNYIDSVSDTAIKTVSENNGILRFESAQYINLIGH